MAILENEILIEINNSTVKYYRELGYVFPTNGKASYVKGTKILVKVDDLPPTSERLLTRVCDECGKKEFNKKYRDISKQRKEGNGKDYCFDCRWKKPTKRKTPYEKCLAVTHPDIAKDLKNKQQAYEVSHASDKVVEFECVRCGYTEKKSVHTVFANKGFSCPKCSDGISYPEKFFTNVLLQLEIKFEKQKIFHWAKNKRYDFYIPEYNMIIETHGAQHYSRHFETLSDKSLEEEQENDRLKEALAKQNSIKNYIVIDCRKSELEYIKKSIINSSLPETLKFNVLDINWLKCHEFACGSLVKKVCDLWNSGVKSAADIGIEINITHQTVLKYLKQGKELGWCDYDSSIVRKLIQKGKKVVQLSLKMEFIEEWSSINKASVNTGINDGGISRACKGSLRTAGGYVWMYKEDYEKNKNSLLLREKNTRKREIVQLSLSGDCIREWESITNVSKELNFDVGSIVKACKGQQMTSKGFKWMYKEDYEKLHT